MTTDTQIKCKGCGVMFTSKRSWQKFHDIPCQQKFWRTAWLKAAELVRQDDRENENA